MKNKRILITGIAGSIGSELARQLAKDNKVYGIDNNESGLFDTLQGELKGRVGDIRDANTIRDVFSDFKPQVVFHCAALKHVPLMEQQELEAINTNILGLHNVLHYAGVYPIEKFVFISTDKAVNPDSIMGGTKRLGEIMTRNKGKGFIAVRFGNVLGSRGSLIPIWEKQLNQGQAITVTDKRMERFFMTIEQACDLVIKAGDDGKGGEIYILDMGEPIKILDLAKQFTNKIKITGIRPGEKLTEKLMTTEEESRAVKKGKFYII